MAGYGSGYSVAPTPPPTVSLVLTVTTERGTHTVEAPYDPETYSAEEAFDLAVTRLRRAATTNNLF